MGSPDGEVLALVADDVDVRGATVASTLGLGEHYAVDLIAAVPLTAALVWVVERQWAFRLGPVHDQIAADSEPA